MDKPHYANAFTSSYNPNLKELVINFTHEYPEATPMQDASEEKRFSFSTKQEDVCGVVLPEPIARQLIEILSKAINAEYEQNS